MNVKLHWRAAVSFCVSECGIAELITNMALVILPSFSDVQYVLEILVISHKIYVQLNADSAAKNKTYTILHTLSVSKLVQLRSILSFSKTCARKRPYAFHIF